MTHNNRVSIIELQSTDTLAVGARTLSSVARENGYDRKLIFLCGDNIVSHKGLDSPIIFPPAIENQILELVEGSDLVGVSFLTNFYERAAHLSDFIRNRLGIPVIWGGVHAQPNLLKLCSTRTWSAWAKVKIPGLSCCKKCKMAKICMIQLVFGFARTEM